MKKRLVLFIFMILVSSCRIDFNGPLRRKMLNYYSNDNNYVELIGVVKSIGDFANKKIEVAIAIEENNYDFCWQPSNEDGNPFFAIYSLDKINLNLKKDDAIKFTSAGFCFYNNQLFPIVSLEKDGEVLLEFEVGKNNYLNWIKEAFK